MCVFGQGSSHQPAGGAGQDSRDGFLDLLVGGGLQGYTAASVQPKQVLDGVGEGEDAAYAPLSVDIVTAEEEVSQLRVSKRLLVAVQLP
jgi:hypothetical protein